jgi:hypothetical protein
VQKDAIFTQTKIELLQNLLEKGSSKMLRRNLLEKGSSKVNFLEKGSSKVNF